MAPKPLRRNLPAMLTHLEFIVPAPSHGRPFAADATYLADGQPKPVVVFVHGFKGFKDWGHFPLLGDFFAAQGFVFVKLNLSHNGVVVGGTGDLEDLDAFGRNNFSLELDDIGHLLDALHEHEAAPVSTVEMNLERLFLIGHSRGGGAVLLKAAEDARVRAVAAWASIADVNQRWSEAAMREWQAQGVVYVDNSRTGQRLPLYYQLVEDYQKNQARLDIAHNVAERLHQPLLIVHGDQDETVPLRAAQQLHALRPGAELQVLPGVGHAFGGAHPWAPAELPADARQVAELTADFFRRQI
jgi:pimeloyl-ACP methyl ester carboxylesterase